MPVNNTLTGFAANYSTEANLSRDEIFKILEKIYELEDVEAAHYILRGLFWVRFL
jgi:hypothetical protein